MNSKSRTLKLTLLLLACLLLHLYARDEARVESGYSRTLFPLIGRSLRGLTGFLPFSIGDILYGLLVCWLIYKLFRKVRTALAPKQTSNMSSDRWGFWYRLTWRAGIIYLIFNVFWGINYNRQGISSQLGLSVRDYTVEELRNLNCLLILKVNQNKEAAIRQQSAWAGHSGLFREVKAAYQRASREYSFLDYPPASLKSSLWGWLGNYTGFTGYYNPFTGEAQVNTTVPAFLQPFIGCHEAAHQLGYARENEANFVGFLAARASDNPAVRYSAYIDLFTYANRSLYALDSSSAKLYRKELSKPVQQDIEEWIRFNRRHQGIVEPLVRWAYGKYLQSNKQPKGIFSYDEVTAFLIAYYRTFGHI